MKKRLFQQMSILIYPVMDFIVVGLSIMVAYKLYRISGLGTGVIYPKMDILSLSFLIGAFAILSMHAFGVYKLESSVLNVEEIKNTVKGTTVVFVGIMFVIVFGKLDLSRYVVACSYLISTLALVAVKTYLYHRPFFALNLEGYQKRILIYGAGDLGRSLYRELTNSPKFNIVPVGFIDDDSRNKGRVYHRTGYNSSEGIAVLGAGRDIPRLVEDYRIDEVYIAMSNLDYERLREILYALRVLGVKTSFVPHLHRLFIHKLRISVIGEIPLIQEEEDVKTFYLFVKRGFDIGLALTAILLTWPLFLMIGLLIKADSRGPVIFRQDRVGKDGKIFQMYKFRTMSTEADPYAVNPLHHDDPRITRFGRFLRKASLDELPQMFNVLKGDMSIVGPRPEMPFIVETYGGIHKERLKVLPGITGLWQLSGDRHKAIHENMDYDLYYIRNMSFFLDVAILIETLIFAFRGV